jgi:cation diffusion facilitator family transporter
MTTAGENYSIQKKLAFITVLLFLIKIIAWYLTKSVAILTDALEYTINVIASFISLYSLHLSSQPRDVNHPYGHGKVEFLSAAVEGLLMIISSFLIIYGAIENLRFPTPLQKLNTGIYLIAFTALLNYAVGYFAIRKGRKNATLVLIATGKHMQTDTYATLGIIAGLVLIFFTGYLWLDSIVSIAFAIVISFTGYKILRSSVSGIMDEADNELLTEFVDLLNEKRRHNWMDLHNLRIIKYGSVLHLDFHLTVPWYFNINEGHDEVDELNDIVKMKFGESMEMFVHTDGCVENYSCKICFKNDCPVRKHETLKKIEWTVENAILNKKHTA